MLRMDEASEESRSRRKSNTILQPNGTSVYTVKQSDTLAGIATHCDTTTSIIKKLNRLMSDLVFPGQTLFIPNSDYIPSVLSPTSYGMAVADKFTACSPIQCARNMSSELRNTKIVGHVERLHTAEPEEPELKPRLPRPLSVEEVKQLLEQCDERFIKLHVQRILRTQTESIPGVMLVTPDCVMFDPGPLIEPVIESGDERYAMILPMNGVLSVAVYHDMKVLQVEKKSRQSKECVNEGNLMTLPNNVQAEVATPSSTSSDSDNIESVAVNIASTETSADIIDSTQYELQLCDETEHQLGIVDEDLQIYLCIKGINAQAPSISEKLTKSDKYWFCIPYEKVDQLFAFFIQWSPHLCEDDSSRHFADEHGFIVVNNLDDNDDLPPRQPKLCRSTSFSKDWEIVNVRELQLRVSEAEIENLPLPTLSHPSDILEESHLRLLMNHLPARAEGGSWRLVYSTNKHGFSLRTLYRHMNAVDSPVLLIIKERNGQVFGTMQSSSIKRSDLFYGTGESYLFTFSPEFKKFRWTGVNNFFTKGSPESLCFGASKGNNGLWLDGDLYHGRTQHCQTYSNDILCTTEDFTIEYLEAWCFD